MASLFRTYLNAMLFIFSRLVFLAVSIAAVAGQNCGINPSCTFQNGQCWCCHRAIRLGDEFATKHNSYTNASHQSRKAKVG